MNREANLKPSDEILADIKSWLIEDGCTPGKAYSFDLVATEISRYLEAFLANVDEIKVRKDVQ